MLLGVLLQSCSAPKSTAPVTSSSTAGAAFTDITTDAGIDFVHFNGASGRKLFPEMMGSGAAWLDADGDGLLDLLLVNGASLPGDPKPSKPGNRFYHNLGGGKFADWTKRSGLTGGGYGMGAAVGDIDNDGDSDVLVTNLGTCRLYLNQEGTFTDVTEQAGVSRQGFWSSAAFLDYDADGRLDLYVCNYVDLPEPMDRIQCRNPHGGLQYCDVHLFDGMADALYHNQGNGQFKYVSESAGIAAKRGRSLAVVCYDADADGHQDILVANDENPNFLWRNNGDGTFREAAAEMGLAYDHRGETIAGMGLDVGDVDRDGKPDVYESGFHSEENILFHGEAPGLFVDRTNAFGIGEISRQYLSFGLGFFDYDLDGWSDLFVTNGHVIDDVHQFNTEISYEQTPLLLRNTGGTQFEDRSSALGGYGREPRVGRGVAFADFDNDGDVDLLVSNNHQRVALLRNDTPPGNHWITVRCIGGPSNRDGLGARVTVEAGNVHWTDEIRVAYSYLCSNDPRITVGLGAVKKIDRISIQWPGGRTEEFANLAPDKHLTVIEGQGIR
jgi:hypothetical protein